MRRLFFLLTFLLTAPSALAHPGVGIVMDSRGNVYYTDLKQVWKIAPDGKRSVVVPNAHTHELYLDAQDNLYGEHLWYEGEATNKWGHRVWRLRPDGALEEVIPAREGFRTDYSFVRDAAGNMYWAESGSRVVVRKRAPDGQAQDWGTGAVYHDIRWMTATADGTLFFIDGADLRRIAPDGAVTTVARNLSQRAVTQFFVQDHHVLMGLWTDSPGNVYVAVYAARLVKRVSPSGQVTVAARSPWFWSPTGGMVVPDGDLWLLEYSLANAARVRRIRKDGRETIY